MSPSSFSCADKDVRRRRVNTKRRVRGSKIVVGASIPEYAISLTPSCSKSARPPSSARKRKENRSSSRALQAPSLEDVLVRKRCFSAHTRKWSEWNTVLRRRSRVTATRDRTRRATHGRTPQATSISLPLGGTINIYPDLLSEQEQKELTRELLHNGTLFRQYRIQGGPEPRAHFLLNQHATMDESAPQPGYRYSSIKMKAKPLNLLPKLQDFSKSIQKTCNVPDWNIGVNPVYYRGGRDRMGFHADNDQDEKLILTCIVRSPSKTRPVVIQTAPRKGTKKRQDGDEQYELTLGAGDAYDMDGNMQQRYVHGVPNSQDDNDPTSGRIAIVFRHGQTVMQNVDSGEPLKSLEPRALIPQTFGRMDGLVEGESYIRSKLLELGAHRSPQGGISGNKMMGCDAIIVTGARPDGLGDDCLRELIYAAESRVGAGGILTSMKKKKSIRVFRSSANPMNSYRALPTSTGPTRYRYDGLYRVESLTFFEDETGVLVKETATGTMSPLKVGRIYQFHMKRIEAGKGATKNARTIHELVKFSIGINTLGSEALQDGRLVFRTPKLKQLTKKRVVSQP